jgi:hypothetical protein
MAFTTDMMAGVVDQDQAAKDRKRRVEPLLVQPNSEPSCFCENVPAAYPQKITADMFIPCLPDMVFRH